METRAAFITPRVTTSSKKRRRGSDVCGKPSTCVALVRSSTVSPLTRHMPRRGCHRLVGSCSYESCCVAQRRVDDTATAAEPRARGPRPLKS